MIDLIAAYQEVKAKKRAFELESHLHDESYLNVSSAGQCQFKLGAFDAHVEYQPMTGLKADAQALDVGNDWHDKVQEVYQEYFDTPEWKAKNIYFGKEITITLYIPELRRTWISRVDIALSDKPFVKKMHKYRNQEREITVLAEGAKFLQIADIKSAGSWGFWEMMKQDDLNLTYKMQGIIYLKATGLSEMDFIIFNKEKGWVNRETLCYKEEMWEQLIKRTLRRFALCENIRDQKAEIKASDFECLDPKSIDWYSCPWSETEESVDEKSGKPSLKLINICIFAQPFLKEMVIAKFSIHPTQLWKRGNSHIKILAHTETGVISINKNGDQYTDTFCFAWRNYKEYNEEEEKAKKKKSKSK